MCKLFMALIMSYSLLFSSDNFPTLSNDELFLEPNICDRVYNDCIDECEKRSPNTFTNCLTECSSLYEECKEQAAGNTSQILECRDSYRTCTLECEEKVPQLEQNKCYSDCEITFDKCIDN